MEVVHPLKPLFCSRYMDDIYNRHNKDEFDSFSCTQQLP